MKKVIYSALVLGPVLASAQNLGNVNSLVSNLRDLVNNIIPLLLAVAVLYFFWGLVQFIINSGKDPKAVDAGRSHMIYGILAIFIMVSLFGIINWLGNTAGLNNGAVPIIPRI